MIYRKLLSPFILFSSGAQFQLVNVLLIGVLLGILVLLTSCSYAPITGDNLPDHIVLYHDNAEGEEPVLETGGGDAASPTVSRTPLSVTAGDGIPALYIDLEEAADKYVYRKASFTFQGENSLTIDGKIKIRGNSTADAKKKPYNIKLQQKASLFGMEESKKWVLLANAFDKTMLRNKLVMDFALPLSFSYTPESIFVEVYVNGEYTGLYQLSEDANVGKGRIDIEPARDFWIELDVMRTEFSERYMESSLGMRFKVRSPDAEDITGEELDELRAYLDQFDETSESGDYSEIAKVFDIDSFVDYYLVSELFKDVDGRFSSRYFTIDRGKLYAGPVWDYDLSCGNVSEQFIEPKYKSYHNAPGWGGDDSGDSAQGIWMQYGWFEELMQCDAFAEKVRERYRELHCRMVNLYEDNELGQNQIDRLVTLLSDAVERNNELWPLDDTQSMMEHKPFDTYSENIEFLRDWFARRVAFLDSVYLTD